jgi:hypothetical protein
MSSRLTHVTSVPTGTVSEAGPKLKLSILISIAAGLVGCDRVGAAPDGDNQSKNKDKNIALHSDSIFQISFE